MSTPARPARGRPDVVSLVFGLLLTAIASTALWLSVIGSVDWRLLQTAAPFALVGVGVLGLLLTRRR